MATEDFRRISEAAKIHSTIYPMKLEEAVNSRRVLSKIKRAIAFLEDTSDTDNLASMKRAALILGAIQEINHYPEIDAEAGDIINLTFDASSDAVFAKCPVTIDGRLNEDLYFVSSDDSTIGQLTGAQMTKAELLAGERGRPREQIVALAHDMFDRHIFDSHLRLTPQSEPLYRKREADAKTYIEAQLVRNTGVGDHSACCVLHAHMLDAATHGFSESPEYPVLKARFKELNAYYEREYPYTPAAPDPPTMRGSRPGRLWQKI